MHLLIEAKSLLIGPGKIIGDQYKINGIAQAVTKIVRSLRIKKDSLRHFVKTVSIGVDQVMFQVKCTPRYFTVARRERSSSSPSWSEHLL